MFQGRVASLQEENVRLLTLNIFMLPGGDNGQYKAGRLAYFTQNVLKDYDIVCLQEMFSSFSGRQSQLVDAAKRQGFEAVREDWKPLSGLVDGGLVILSRLPVVKRKHLIYRSGTKADALSREFLSRKYPKTNLVPSISRNPYSIWCEPQAKGFSTRESGCQATGATCTCSARICKRATPPGALLRPCKSSSS